MKLFLKFLKEKYGDNIPFYAWLVSGFGTCIIGLVLGFLQILAFETTQIVFLTGIAILLIPLAGLGIVTACKWIASKINHFRYQYRTWKKSQSENRGKKQ